MTGTRWGLHSSRGRVDVAAGRLGFDCGFLAPEDLNPRIRLITHHRYWSGLVGIYILGSVVVFGGLDG